MATAVQDRATCGPRTTEIAKPLVRGRPHYPRSVVRRRRRLGMCSSQNTVSRRLHHSPHMSTPAVRGDPRHPRSADDRATCGLQSNDFQKPTVRGRPPYPRSAVKQFRGSCGPRSADVRGQLGRPRILSSPQLWRRRGKCRSRGITVCGAESDTTTIYRRSSTPVAGWSLTALTSLC